MRKTPKGYLQILRERRRASRVRFKHQSTGLVLAEILEDRKHKPLYMRLANIYDAQILIQTARDVAARSNIKNKGAYFMRVFQRLRRGLVPQSVAKKPKQLKLKLRRKERLRCASV